MNTLLDQELSEDHQTRLKAGLRDYDGQCLEEQRMSHELQQRFESIRQREEEQDARLLDTAFQSEQRLLHTIESASLNDDHTANLSHAAVTIARLRSRLTEVTR